jgi:hypothetical protein
VSLPLWRPRPLAARRNPPPVDQEIPFSLVAPGVVELTASVPFSQRSELESVPVRSRAERPRPFPTHIRKDVLVPPPWICDRV